MINQKEAIAIAKELYGNKCSYCIDSGVPDSYLIYGSEKWSRDDVWCVAILGRHRGVGASSVLVISKDTGKILFDGEVGE